ncbi:hypothetical protein [Ignatzschineria indica]
MEGLDAEVEARFLETLAQLERAGATIIYRDSMNYHTFLILIVVAD